MLNVSKVSYIYDILDFLTSNNSFFTSNVVIFLNKSHVVTYT